jgi:hypothetical protein
MSSTASNHCVPLSSLSALLLSIEPPVRVAARGATTQILATTEQVVTAGRGSAREPMARHGCPVISPPSYVPWTDC